jgi:hypothetical protein
VFGGFVRERNSHKLNLGRRSVCGLQPFRVGKTVSVFHAETSPSDSPVSFVRSKRRSRPSPLKCERPGFPEPQSLSPTMPRLADQPERIGRLLSLAVQAQEGIEDGRLDEAHAAAVELERGLEKLRDAA